MVNGIEQLKNIYKKFKNYIDNTGWILFGNLFQMAISFAVSIYVARHLGAETYGILSYSLALVSIISVMGHMGLSGLVVKYLLDYPDQKAITLTTVFYIKLFALCSGYLLLILYSIFFEELFSHQFYVILIVGFTLLISSFEAPGFWFESEVKSKFVVFTKLISSIATSTMKLILIYIGLDVIAFAWSSVFQALIVATLIMMFFVKNKDFEIRAVIFDKNLAISLLRKGSLIFLGAIFAVIYIQIDQIMLRWFDGIKSVGIYAIAAQLSQVWYFIPAALVSTFYPKLIMLKKNNVKLYNKRLQQLIDLLFLLGALAAIIIIFSADYIINTFFGPEYAESSSILKIHILAGVFIFMRAALSKWIIIEDLLIFSLLTQGLGALSNILLNYYLIPLYGGLGAAYATLISYSIASFFALLVNKKTRPIFLMMVKAILIPLRLLNFKKYIL